MAEGVIYKGVGGFYTVKTAGGALVECRARGVLRSRGQKPVAGDRVLLGHEAGTDYIDALLPRKNLLVRPPVANVDRLFIVASTVRPVPSFLVIDRLAAAAIDQEVEPVLVVSKPDLAPAEPLEEAYKSSGIPVLVVCAVAGQGLEALRALLPGVFSVFCGNSGVGKSTLLNALLPGLCRQVGEISQKLGRGRHTTREVEVFEVDGAADGAAQSGGVAAAAGAAGLVADTPGFASLDPRAAGPILAANLQLCFPEIKERVGQCRFSGCSHVAEAGCAVREAVAQGLMARSRYDSYVTMYSEAKQAEMTYR